MALWGVGDCNSQRDLFSMGITIPSEDYSSQHDRFCFVGDYNP